MLLPQTSIRPSHRRRHVHHGESCANASVLNCALRLRYQVYCREFKFLPASDYPGCLESDEHDADAAHFYAFDDNEELAGYVRLVRADVNRRFPVQYHCAVFDDRFALPPVEASAEVSRLMVRSDYRRRREDTVAGICIEAEESPTVGSVDRRREAPEVLKSLYGQMSAYSRASGIGHWYAAMERPLARTLSRHGCSFSPIGPPTDYYGPVTPYVVGVDQIESAFGEGF